MADQLYIDGTEPPGRIPEIEEALDGWIDAKVEQKRASETTKLAHSVLVSRLNEAGVEKYAYTDRTTGKRRFVYPDRTPKLKTAAAPRSRRRDDDERSEPEVGEEVTHEAVLKDADKVESRRVSRASVADEIDPFAATRAGMNGGILEQAEATMRGETIPIAEGRAKRAKKGKKRGRR